MDTIFTSLTGDGTAILRGHPSHEKVQPLKEKWDYLHFSDIFKRPWLMANRTRELSLCSQALYRLSWSRLFSLWDSKQCKTSKCVHRNIPLQNWWVTAAWCSQINHYTVVLSQPFRPRSYEEKLGSLSKLFPLNKPWRYKICIAWFLYTCRDDLTENFGKTTAQECKKSTSGWRASFKNAFA